MTTRWIFYDPVTTTSYTVPVNPNRMSSPFPPKAVSTGARSPVTGQYRVWREQPQPAEWTFGGFVYTAAHHDALLAWSQVPNPIQITDHLGRTFNVLIKEFAPTERQATKTNTDRYEYEIRALSFGLA